MPLRPQPSTGRGPFLCAGKMKEAPTDAATFFLVDDFRQVLKFVCKSCQLREIPKHGGSRGQILRSSDLGFVLAANRMQNCSMLAFASVVCNTILAIVKRLIPVGLEIGHEALAAPKLDRGPRGGPTANHAQGVAGQPRGLNEVRRGGRKEKQKKGRGRKKGRGEEKAFVVRCGVGATS